MRFLEAGLGTSLGPVRGPGRGPEPGPEPGPESGPESGIQYPVSSIQYNSVIFQSNGSMNRLILDIP